MIKVESVEFYSGGRRDEYPRMIKTTSGVIRVEEIISSYLEEEYKSGKRERVFYFKSKEGTIYCLKSSKDGFGLKDIQEQI